MTRVVKTLVSRSERWEGRARDSREGTLLTVGVGSGLLRHKHTAGCLNRPHGQHAVVLAEDAHRFTAYRADHRGEDLSGINPSSRQIYLTFPAESTFTEEDVTSHFRWMLPASIFCTLYKGALNQPFLPVVFLTSFGWMYAGLTVQFKMCGSPTSRSGCLAL